MGYFPMGRATAMSTAPSLDPSRARTREGWIVVDGERFFVPGQKRNIARIDGEVQGSPSAR